MSRKRLYNALKQEDVRAAIAASVDRKDSKGRFTFARIPDGRSLSLMTRNGHGYWQFQYKDGRSIRSKMLGTAGTVTGALSPNQARQERERFRLEWREGRAQVRPRGVAANRQAAAESANAPDKLFGDVVTQYLEGYLLPSTNGGEPVRMVGVPIADNWRGGPNGGEAKSYRRTLLGSPKQSERHAIALRPVAEITTEDVQKHLASWDDRPVTRDKVRSRVEVILNNAKARGLRSGDNPAAKDVFDHLPGPKPPKAVSHPAMGADDVPALMGELIAMGDPTARALAFMILTATRTDETRLARWREIDVKKKLWIIPGFVDGERRMKEGLEHRVPLTDAALKVIGKPGKPNEFVFPSPTKGAMYPIWDNGANHLMKRLLRDGKIAAVDGGRCPVPHGFRSTFSNWAMINGYPLELREMALAHSIGDAVVRAYNRPLPELYKVRIPMTQAWSDFVMGRRARSRKP